MEQKPGRNWGVVGQKHLPVGFEQAGAEATELFRSLFTPCAPVQNACVSRNKGN
jgi:hypothetical protein